MSKSKPQRPHRMCGTCGTNSQCQTCSGSGHWSTHPEIKCGHCNGSGRCPVNR